MMSKKQIIYIKEDILNSFTTPSSKDRISKLLDSLEQGRIRPKYLMDRVAYLIRMGHSDLQKIEQLQEIHDYKMYLEKNKDEYGEINENKSNYSYS